MQIGTTEIVDTFAEAFGMRYTRLIVTAHDDYWLEAATSEIRGYGSSVIACDAEVGIEQRLPAEESPDGRPAAAILAFGFSAEALAKAITNRVGQCVMTCPSTALFDGLPMSSDRIPLGRQLRFFGDGFQKSKQIGKSRYWRIPVMDGEFWCADSLGMGTGVAGGNIILQAVNQAIALNAARRGVEAIAKLAGSITPFPGGVARSGSKVGSRYSGLKASTAESYCPTLRSQTKSKLADDAHCVLEIVIDGMTESDVIAAMQAGTLAVAEEGVLAITAGNYGGVLGAFKFHLHDLLGVADFPLGR